MSLAVETDVGAARVYGCSIPTYTVDGAKGCGLVEAVSFGALRQSLAIETLTTAVGQVVKLRQQKATEIGEAVATVTEAIGSMDPKDQDPDKQSAIDPHRLTRANEIFKKYGIPEMNLDEESGQVTYDTAYRKQNDVQLALDTENNDLQQNLNNLSNLVAKRDNAFIVASKVVDKINMTAKDAIRAVGA